MVKNRKEREKKLITVEVSAAELAKIDIKASEAGLTRSKYIRGLALDGKIVAKMNPAQRQLYEVISKLGKEISKQGANLNQAVKSLNTLAQWPDSTVDIDSNHLQAAIEANRDVARILKEIWAGELVKNDRKNK